TPSPSSWAATTPAPSAGPPPTRSAGSRPSGPASPARPPMAKHWSSPPPTGQQSGQPPGHALLLGQQIPRRWLDPRPPQRPRHEVALGVAIGIAVITMPPGELILQNGVLAAKPGIGAQGVPEGHQRQRMRMPTLDQ